METLLKHAGAWKTKFKEPLESLLRDCKVCEQSGEPSASIPVDISHINPEFNDEVEVDITYVKAKPSLHVECKKTKWSEASPLSSRNADTLWNTFLKIRILNSGPVEPLSRVHSELSLFNS